MSGHSKWSNIKRQKAVNDAKRSQIFTKIGRLITVAARIGGGDPDANPSLRLAIDKAKQARMSKETIEKAIARGAGGGTGENFEEVTYEGFGPSGGAILIHALTDNKNRTVAEIKNILSRAGGSLGTPGSVSYIFDSETKDAMFNIDVVDDETKEKVENLLDTLEDHDDVQDVYANYAFI